METLRRRNVDLCKKVEVIERELDGIKKFQRLYGSNVGYVRYLEDAKFTLERQWADQQETIGKLLTNIRNSPPV